MASAAAAIGWLSEPRSKVSCHYVIDERGRSPSWSARRCAPGTPDFPNGPAKPTSTRSRSGSRSTTRDTRAAIRISPQSSVRGALARDIVARWSIAPSCILAHSDVAPTRKIDPGEKFDWAWLAEAGVGHCVARALVTEDCGLQLGDAGTAIAEVQDLLARYGYGVEAHGDFDERTGAVVAAFQRHFRPARVDGCIDQSTITTPERLLAGLATART